MPHSNGHYDQIVPPHSRVENPGAMGTADIWDSTNGELSIGFRRRMLWVKRITVCAFIDTAATFYVDILTNDIDTAATWRTINGNGSGEPIAANTLFQRSVPRFAPNQKCYILTILAPGVFEVTYLLHPDAGLSQSP